MFALPEQFSSVAVSLRPYGVNESAVPLDVASDLVTALASQQHAILGGDFWHIRNNRLALATEPWAIPYKGQGEAWSAYVDGSLNAASSRLRWAADYFKDAKEPVLVAVQSCSEADYNSLQRRHTS